MQAAEQVMEDRSLEEIDVQYTGDGGDLLLLFIKNIFLSIVTFGIYSCWGKVNILQYHASHTKVQNQPLSFTGSGKEILIGRLKLLFLAIVVVGIPIALLTQVSLEAAQALGQLFFVLLLAALGPFAILGTFKYRLSRTQWLGNTFRVDYKNKRKFIIKYFLLLISIPFSLGLTVPALTKHIAEYLLNSVSYGQLKLKLDADVSTLKKYALLSLVYLIAFIGLIIFATSISPLSVPLVVLIGYLGFLLIASMQNMEALKTFFHGLQIDSAELKIRWARKEVMKTVIITTLLSMTGIGIPFAMVYFRKFLINKMDFKGHVDTKQFSASEEKGGALGEAFTDYADLDFGAL